MAEQNEGKPERMLVRLKAFNPRRGFVLQRYTVFGIRFEAGTGWSSVEPDVAEYLRSVHERDTDPGSPLAFDVCTKAEAEAMVEAERRAREAAVAAVSAPRIVERDADHSLVMARTVETAPGAQPPSTVGRIGSPGAATPTRVHGPTG